MHATIEVAIDEKDTNRGYHDRKGTITFTYHGIQKWHEAREMEMIKHITGGVHMWFSCAKSAASTQFTSVYELNYGYDSGD